jgi:hypothetical protein
MMLSSATNGGVGGGAHDEPAAGEALADVVVGVALERSVMPLGTNAPKLWPAEPLEVMSMVSSGRPGAAVRLVTSWPSIVPTVRLTLRIGNSSLTFSPLDAPAGALDERAGRAHGRGRGPGSWCCAAPPAPRRSGTCRIGVRSSPTPSSGRRPRSVSSLDVADGLLERAEAELGQQLAHLLGDEEHEVSTNSGLPAEAGAQLGVLGGDADRAGVEVADAHHDAARHDQRRGGEAELLGAEQRGDHDVAAGLQLAVGLHDDAVAQAVEQQRLLGLGEAELPGAPACLSDVSGLAPVPPSWPEISTTSAWPWRRRRRPCRRRPRPPASRGRGLPGWRS